MDLENGVSDDYLPMDPKRLLERFDIALNTRDITNLIHCLQVDYEQAYPSKNSESTIGLSAAQEYWEDLFNRYPVFRADLERQALEGSEIWTEWHWYAKGGDGNEKPINKRGVIIFGVENCLIAWSRIYMQEVQS